jgi:hypothetical protein
MKEQRGIEMKRIFFLIAATLLFCLPALAKPERISNSSGSTPYQIAKDQGNKPMLDLLAKAGVKA